MSITKENDVIVDCHPVDAIDKLSVTDSNIGSGGTTTSSEATVFTDLTIGSNTTKEENDDLYAIFANCKKKREEYISVIREKVRQYILQKIYELVEYWGIWSDIKGVIGEKSYSLTTPCMPMRDGISAKDVNLFFCKLCGFDFKTKFESDVEVGFLMKVWNLSVVDLKVELINSSVKRIEGTDFMYKIKISFKLQE